MKTFHSNESPFESQPRGWKCGVALKEKFSTEMRNCKAIGLDHVAIEKHLEEVEGCPVANFSEKIMRAALEYLSYRQQCKRKEILQGRG